MLNLKPRLIELTQGYWALISPNDYRRVRKYSWHVHKSRGKGRNYGQPYARATIEGRKVYLHRFITGAENPLHVDHLNHQTLDCRRENLEIVDHVTNCRRRRVCQS